VQVVEWPDSSLSSYSLSSSSNCSEVDGVDSSASGDGTVTVEGAGIGSEIVPG
jgi:hypothetical protein